MNSDPAILARLAAIEQQNQQMLMLLAKLAGIQAPQVSGMSKGAMELIALAKVDRAASIAECKRRSRESSKKKPSPDEVRA